jgi:hypothetical protein
VPDVVGPAARYDKPRLLGQRVLAVILSLAFVALVTAIVVTLTKRAFSGNPTASVTGYSVVSDGEVSIRFTVQKRAGDRAFCIVRARGLDGSEVGRDVAAVDPDGLPEKSVRTEFSLTTSGRAVTGEVAGCSSKPISKAVDPDHH